MKSIHVRYFALFRERAGKSSETIETSADTPEMLFGELSKRYGFELPVNQVKVSVNGSFSEMTGQLESESSVVFIPPVAGG